MHWRPSVTTDLVTQNRTDIAAAGQAADPRRIAVMALGAEDTVLSYKRAYDEASDLWRKARNPPDGCASTMAWALEHLPPVAALETVQRQVTAVGGAMPDPKQNRVFVALLADSFPANRGASGVATEALLHDLKDGGFCPAAVAQGLREIRKTSKFAPAICEVLEAVEKAQDYLNRVPNYIGMMIRERTDLDRRAQRQAELAAVSAPE